MANEIDMMDFEQSDTLQKPKRKSNGRNSPVIGNNGVAINKGDAAKYANVLMDLSSWDAVDRSDVEELEIRFHEYLMYCAQNDLKIGNQMAYLALGLSKDNVYDMEHGRSFGSSHSDFIKKVKQICAGNRELLMQDGKVHPITGIFWQKNYDGMRDIQEIDIKSSSALSPTLTADEIAKQIPKDIPVDVNWSEE
jgi:hypothetical protein